MQLTGSISRGRTAEKHNTRECYREGHVPDNIDLKRSAGNDILINRSLEDVYAQTFGAAADAYNAAQVAKGHAERQIPDYLEKVRNDKKLQPMYEFVIQIGNMDEQPDPAAAKLVYRDWLRAFQARYGGHFAVKQAITHMDEATPHMHVELVPVAESKRGLSVQNSMNKAVKQAGFSDYKAMLADWDGILTWAMAARGIERKAGDKEKQMGGVDIDTYRRTKRATERLEQRQGELERRIDAAQAELERVRSDEVDTRAVLGGLQAKVDRKQAVAADLTRLNAEKAAEFEHWQARLDDFSEKEAAAAERLERLRQREKAEAEAVAELDRSIEQARLEPARETVAESAGALWAGRGAGEREEGLRSEVSGLRERISELEGENERARDRIAELEPGVRGLRERLRGLDERLETLEQRVGELLSDLARVPNTLSEWALDVAARLHKPVYNPNSLTEVCRQATAAARAQNASQGLTEPPRRSYWHR